MKKLSYLFAGLGLFAFTSCGGGASTEKAVEETAAEEVVVEDTVEDTAATEEVETTESTEETAE